MGDHRLGAIPIPPSKSFVPLNAIQSGFGYASTNVTFGDLSDTGVTAWIRVIAPPSVNSSYSGSIIVKYLLIDK